MTWKINMYWQKVIKHIEKEIGIWHKCKYAIVKKNAINELVTPTWVDTWSMSKCLGVGIFFGCVFLSSSYVY